MIESHTKIMAEYQLHRQFIVFILISAFQTAETIIHRLADSPTRRLNRRLKYAWDSLKINADGTVSHNFVHTVGNVPREYVATLEEEAPKFMGKNIVDQTAPYFLSDVLKGDSEDLASMILPDTAKEGRQLTDIYEPKQLDMSPCGIHDGTKLRTDCIICKSEIPVGDGPITISKAFLRKINVTENLLKFLAIQQDKRRAREADSGS